MAVKSKSDDKAVALILEGEGISPKTVSPKAAAKLIWEFVEFLEELSEEINVPKGTLRGLEIHTGSFELRTGTTTHVAALAFQGAIHRFVGPPDEEVVPPTRSARFLKLQQRGVLLRRAIQGVGPDVKVKTSVGARRRPLKVWVAESEEGSTEFVSARVVMAGIQATEEESSRAHFRGVLDGASYSLAVSRDQEAKLIAAFRGELEIDAEVSPTRDGGLRGKLLSFEPVTRQGSDVDVWRDWFASAGWEGLALHEVEQGLSLGE